MEKTVPHAKIHGALQLDSNPDTLKDYYAKWAQTYDQDVQGYMGPLLISQYLDKHIHQQLTTDNPPVSELKIADVGCGTGLVARHMADMGYHRIDGMDLSEEMIEKARKTGLYQQLFAGVDINLPAREEWLRKYDAALCCGVFTLGHVFPEALQQLLKMVRRGGIVVTSTRQAYYKSTNYQMVSDALSTDGQTELLAVYLDQPYTNDENAHYWVYRRLL